MSGEEEVWRSVAGWIGVYEVSSRGRVRRLLAASGTQTGRILKPVLSETKARQHLAYFRVTLSRPGQIQRRCVHTLVAEAFLGARPSPSHQLNHLDGVKTNNAVENLEWATVSRNLAHSYAIGLRPRVGPPRNRYGPIDYAR